jgi:HK97 family phage major capsid protein
LGILNSPSVVSIAAENGQASDTILAENISKMWAQLYAPCRRDAVWLINQDIEPQLDQMQFSVKDASGNIVGGFPLYVPPNGLSATPFATLKGRPVIPTQACNTLGSLGDIILVDLKQYMTAFKAGGVKSDVSIHLWFDYDVTAYRFVLRIAGQPWWATYITPLSGSNYLSWAVTLAERP